MRRNCDAFYEIFKTEERKIVFVVLLFIFTLKSGQNGTDFIDEKSID